MPAEVCSKISCMQLLLLHWIGGSFAYETSGCDTAARPHPIPVAGALAEPDNRLPKCTLGSNLECAACDSQRSRCGIADLRLNRTQAGKFPSRESLSLSRYPQPNRKQQIRPRPSRRGISLADSTWQVIVLQYAFCEAGTIRMRMRIHETMYTSAC